MQTLRAARRSRAWSIRKLAEESGVATSTIVAAEKGGPLRLETIRKLSAALGVEPLDIDEFRRVIEGKEKA